MKKVLALIAALSLSACVEAPLYTYTPDYHESAGRVVLVLPEYSLIAVGYPHAHFKKQLTGYKVSYEKNGVIYTTYTKTLYRVGERIYN